MYRIPAFRLASRGLPAFLLLILTAGLLASSLVAPSLASEAEKASLTLQVDQISYQPGSSARLAAIVDIENHWHVNSNQPTYEYLIPTEIAVTLPAFWPQANVTYPEGEVASFTFAEEPLSVYQGRAVILADLTIPTNAAGDGGSATVEVALTYQACNDTQCLPPVTTSESITLDLSGSGAPVDEELFLQVISATQSPTTSTASSSGNTLPHGARSLWTFLLLGVLGGLILNAMPCVLPVLSIKVFSLVKSASQSRREVTRSGLATAAGILVSFWALAGAAILARSAGRAVGWGVQFQEPVFVAILAIIVLLFTLNMWGLFEIQLPGRWSQLGGKGPEEGVAGHFASGLFATLMATPCSAPFLGTAVGFALAQPPLTILAIFTAVGLGMAAPYLLLAAWPGAAGLLPKPGVWMLRLKEMMGFFLAGAAIWLFYVLAGQISAERLAVVELSLLVLALFVWFRHSAQSPTGKRIALFAALLTGASTIWLAATAPPVTASTTEVIGGHIAWTPFDRATAEEMAVAGTPVFVDVTADWCFTCKVNERFVLDTPEIATAFAELGVVPMQADWTSRDQEIGNFLADHGRYGIPFYLLYRPGQEPFVFGELLTQDGILQALASISPSK
ncbi:MAG: thioredoxin family protein [Thermoanaerobaculia bacterium]|nr:thioredoxin family protein [Thermoanaerobaculia bacterium]